MLNDQELARLKKLKISEERFGKESKSLLNYGYNQDQVKKLIMRAYSEKTVAAVISKTRILRSEPYELNLEEILKISAHGGGGKNLEVIERYFMELITFGFNKTQIVKMVSHHGGSKNLEAVQGSFAALQGLGFIPEQIIRMVSHDGGSKNLEMVKTLFVELRAKGIGLEKITACVNRNGGSGALLVLLETQEVSDILLLLMQNPREEGLYQRLGEHVFFSPDGGNDNGNGPPKRLKVS